MKFKTSDYLMRQIKISNETYLKIKYYCQNNNISLIFFYERMLNWFLNKYPQNAELVYQASIKQDRVLSLWIKGIQLEQITKMAKRAKVSDARVIDTALTLYLQNKAI